MISCLIFLFSVAVSLACHEQANDECSTKTMNNARSCKYCCWDGNSAWAISTFTKVADSACNLIGGGCKDFSSTYGTRGKTDIVSTQLHKNGTAVTVSCNSPYYLVGSSAIVTCQQIHTYESGNPIRSDDTKVTCTYCGMWTPIPDCLLGCTAPTISNALLTYDRVQTSNGVYEDMTVATVNCRALYYISGTSRMTCLFGKWTSEPKCLPGCDKGLTVPNSEPITYDKQTVANGYYPDTTKAHLRCKTGYYLEGSETVSCLSGYWSPVSQCIAGCNSASVPNSIIQYSTAKLGTIYKENSEAVVVCNEAYFLSGNPIVTCISGSWSQLPSCIFGCNSSIIIQNAAKVTYDNPPSSSAVYVYNTKATVICSSGYYAIGNVSVACVGTTWSQLPQCLRGCEPIPDWSNGSIAYNFAPTSNSLFTNGTVVTFNCSHELSLIGQSTARCLNGNWTNPPPICEEKPRLPIAVEILMDMGCAILLILVGITFMTFIILRDHCIETCIHIGEEISLFISHILILALRNRVDLEWRNCLFPVVCTLTSVALQYFYITANCFFLLESIQFLYMLQNITNSGGFCKLNQIHILLMGFSIAMIPTGMTFAFRHYYYKSRYSCWVNLGNEVAFGTIVPVVILFLATLLFTEAAAMGRLKSLPLANKTQRTAAKFNQKSILIVMGVNTASWFTGLFAVYNLTVWLSVTVSALNITLGVCIIIFHYMGTPTTHNWYQEKIVNRLCKSSKVTPSQLYD